MEEANTYIWGEFNKFNVLPFHVYMGELFQIILEANNQLDDAEVRFIPR